MKESYKKIIKNFILPKFPWVDKFEVAIAEDDSFVNVVYSPKSKKGKSFTVRKEFVELEILTDEVLKMMGCNRVSVYFKHLP